MNIDEQKMHGNRISLLLIGLSFLEEFLVLHANDLLEFFIALFLGITALFSPEEVAPLSNRHWHFFVDSAPFSGLLRFHAVQLSVTNVFRQELLFE